MYTYRRARRAPIDGFFSSTVTNEGDPRAETGLKRVAGAFESLSGRWTDGDRAEFKRGCVIDRSSDREARVKATSVTLEPLDAISLLDHATLESADRGGRYLRKVFGFLDDERADLCLLLISFTTRSPKRNTRERRKRDVNYS